MNLSSMLSQSLNDYQHGLSFQRGFRKGHARTYHAYRFSYNSRKTEGSDKGLGRCASTAHNFQSKNLTTESRYFYTSYG